jgi:hypothetical protein
MTAKFQVVIDCEDPPRMCEFWAAALGYQVEPPPVGFANWDDYWRDVGLPKEEQQPGPDRLMDPAGKGPSIWFQVVDEPKTIKNRIHLDLGVSGGRTVALEVRKQRVEAEADRLVHLGATRLEAFFEIGVDHYAVAMRDPEGNEFDIN